MIQASAWGCDPPAKLAEAEQVRRAELHHKVGFEQVAHLREGFEFGRWLEVVYLQKML